MWGQITFSLTPYFCKYVILSFKEKRDAIRIGEELKTLCNNMMLNYHYSNCYWSYINLHLILYLECQLFSLTADPDSPDGSLCPQVTTFSCSLENDTDSPYMLTWLFDSNETDAVLLDLTLSSLSLPLTYTDNDQFNVVVESFSNVSSGISVVVQLVVNASLLVQNGVEQVICSVDFEDTRTSFRAFNVSGLNNQSGKLIS